MTVEAEPNHSSGTHQTITVQKFRQGSDLSYSAELHSNKSKELLVIDTAKATQQFIPAAVVLGLLARAGLAAALKWYGKTQVKKASKSYLLRLNARKWKHIMDAKIAIWKYRGKTSDVTYSKGGQLSNGGVR